MQVSLRSFKLKVAKHKTTFKRFLTKIEKNPPSMLDAMIAEIDKEVWQETDCLSCANCCKTMTPTFRPKDIKRIAAHFNIKPQAFKEKWLYQHANDPDWINTSMPCQFLNKQNNMCSIYEVRPDDCAGFPHLTKKKITTYMHVHKQNLTYCPATYKMVEKMRERLLIRQGGKEK
jgi:Fe-S-cluster containining protein